MGERVRNEFEKTIIGAIWKLSERVMKELT